MKLCLSHSSVVRALLVLVPGMLLLAACREVEIPGVYRIDIQQGNVVTQEQLAALESGMEKRKVRFILGTPLVTDAFNQDRWDYYYSFHKLGEDRVQRIVSVFFEAERLVRVSGDVRAASGPIVLPDRADKVVAVPDGYRDEGLLASLMPSFLSNKPKRQPPTDEKPQTEGKATEPAAATSAEPGEKAPAAEVTTASATNPSSIVVDVEDERYLRDLLGGLGRDAQTQESVTTSGETLSATDEQNKEEGLFSTWAKRLGWGDSESSTTSEAGSAPPPSTE